MMDTKVTTRRAILRGAAALPVAGFGGRDAWAQTARGQTTLVVPYAAGGGGDTFARIFANELASASETNVIVENRTGGSGAVGLQHVANAPPDGRTLAFTFGSLALVQALSMKNPPVDIRRDLVPVARVIESFMVLVVHPQARWNTLGEFIDDAKKNPGKISYGDYGDLAFANLIGATGINTVRVPYKGGAPALTDVMGGHVDVVANSVAAAIGAIRGGKVKVLAVTSDSRLAELPNVPTVKESLPDFRSLNFLLGLFAPVATPPATVRRIYEQTAIATGRPSFQKEASARFGATALLAPDEFRTAMELELVTTLAALKAAGIKPE
jgi:tripartite-type tricarboxylate transporter receptor subunit TctC